MWTRQKACEQFFHVKNLEDFCQLMDNACFFNLRAGLVWEYKIVAVEPPDHATNFFNTILKPQQP